MYINKAHTVPRSSTFKKFGVLRQTLWKLLILEMMTGADTVVQEKTNRAQKEESMEIRKADIKDIDALVLNRIEFIKDINKETINIETFEKVTYEALREHLADDSNVAFIAEEEGKIVASAVVCYYNILPQITNLTGKAGYIQNVFTLPDYRRRGLASELVNRIKQDAKERNVGKIYLDATDMGKPVYERLGFEPLPREMVFNIG